MARQEARSKTAAGSTVSGGWSGIFARRRARIRGTLTFLWLILLWEIAARYGVRDEKMFAPFSKVVAALVHLFRTGEIWKHLYFSGYEFVVGFLLAALVGVALGFLMGTVKAARDYLDPWISGLYSAPLVALAPLYIMFFGVGLESKVALVFSVSVFPIIVNTFAGVYSADAGLVEVARAYNATRLQILFKVLVPFSLSYIVTGLRLGVGRGLTGVVVGEFFFANAGLGFLVALAGQTFNTPLLFAGVLVFAAAGVAITGGLKRLEKTLAPWRALEDE
jgi:ABC-type nitrate/sulfonate/bicarbonate transport system permease component